jgi:homoserine kinase type II
MHSHIEKIARHFGVAPITITSAPSTGFSGAGVWRVTEDGGKSFSVKQYANLSAEHLSWVHRVVLHTMVCDCQFVAVPRRDPHGNSILQSDDSIWEVCDWMPGIADFTDNPTDVRLTNAMKALAKFHQSAAQVNFDFRPSPSIRSRIEGLNALPDILSRAKTIPDAFPELKNIRLQLKRLSPHQRQNHLQTLTLMANQTLPLQPVIRDLWHDHLLFTDDQLTGLVDFDAMQMDTIAMDLTRCLGSLCPDNPDRWTVALDAYSTVRPIQKSEMDLINVLPPINVILTAANWLNWISVQGRKFPNTNAVNTRLKTILPQLTTVVG